MTQKANAATRRLRWIQSTSNRALAPSPLATKMTVVVSPTSEAIDASAPMMLAVMKKLKSATLNRRAISAWRPSSATRSTTAIQSTTTLWPARPCRHCGRRARSGVEELGTGRPDGRALAVRLLHCCPEDFWQAAKTQVGTRVTSRPALELLDDMTGKTPRIRGGGNEGGIPSRTVDLEICRVGARALEPARLAAGIRRGLAFLVGHLDCLVDRDAATRRRQANANIDVLAVEEKSFVPAADCVEAVLTDEKAAAGKDVREVIPIVAIVFQARDRRFRPSQSHVHRSNKPRSRSRSGDVRHGAAIRLGRQHNVRVDEREPIHARAQQTCSCVACRRISGVGWHAKHTRARGCGDFDGVVFGVVVNDDYLGEGIQEVGEENAQARGRISRDDHHPYESSRVRLPVCFMSFARTGWQRAAHRLVLACGCHTDLKVR